MSIKEQIVSMLINLMFLIVIVCDATIGTPTWPFICAIAVGAVYIAYLIVRLVRVRRKVKQEKEANNHAG